MQYRLPATMVREWRFSILLVFWVLHSQEKGISCGGWVRCLRSQ